MSGMSLRQTLPALPLRVYMAQRLASGETLQNVAHDLRWSSARARAVLDPSGSNEIGLVDVENALHHAGLHLLDLADKPATPYDGLCRVARPSEGWQDKVAAALGHPVEHPRTGAFDCPLRAAAVRVARRQWRERPTEVGFCPFCSQATTVTMSHCDECGRAIVRPVVTFRAGWEGVDVADAAEQMVRPLTTTEIRDALRAHIRRGPSFRAATATLQRRKYLARVLGAPDKSPYLLESALKREGVVDTPRSQVKADRALWSAERRRAIAWLAKHPRPGDNVRDMPYHGKLDPEMVRLAAELLWDEGLRATDVYEHIAAETGQNAGAVRKQIRRAFRENGWPLSRGDLETIPRTIDDCMLPTAPLVAWIGFAIGLCGRASGAAALELDELDIERRQATGSIDPRAPARQMRGARIAELLRRAERGLADAAMDVPSLADLYEIRDGQRHTG